MNPTNSNDLWLFLDWMSWAVFIVGPLMVIGGLLMFLFSDSDNGPILGVLGSFGGIGLCLLVAIPFPPAPQEAVVTPSSEPRSEPITLPEITNPEAVWAWIAVAACVVVLAVIIYFFVRRVRRDRLRAAEDAARRAKAEVEAKRLAEEKAAREQAKREKQDRIEARWGRITELHAELKRRVAEAETNWDTLFDLPALSDVSFRQTRALHRAMRDAENTVEPMPSDFNEYSPMDRIPYVKKVHAFHDAWEAALANARKVGISRLPADELRTIKRIRLLLKMAEGSGASDNERRTAYAQIRTLLGELHVVQIPREAVLAVDTGRRLALPASSVPVRAARQL